MVGLQFLSRALLPALVPAVSTSCCFAANSASWSLPSFAGNAAYLCSVLVCVDWSGSVVVVVVVVGGGVGVSVGVGVDVVAVVVIVTTSGRCWQSSPLISAVLLRISISALISGGQIVMQWSMQLAFASPGSV